LRSYIFFYKRDSGNNQLRIKLMKLILTVALISIAAPAFGQASLQPRYALTLEQRRAEFERACQMMAPEAWRNGGRDRAAWLANCKKETP
jgi:hypothetical protein